MERISDFENDNKMTNSASVHTVAGYVTGARFCMKTFRVETKPRDVALRDAAAPLDHVKPSYLQKKKPQPLEM